MGCLGTGQVGVSTSEYTAIILQVHFSASNNLIQIEKESLGCDHNQQSGVISFPRACNASGIKTSSTIAEASQVLARPIPRPCLCRVRLAPVNPPPCLHLREDGTIRRVYERSSSPP